MGRINLQDYDTDKGHNYIRYYEGFFEIYRNDHINLLELGMHRGGSIKMWRDYFPYARCFGVDINELDMSHEERIYTYKGDATTPDFLAEFRKSNGVEKFDIIIDDASHMGRDAQKSFEMLFKNHLSPGGMYVVEDWGTGYMPDWPDGDPYQDLTQSSQKSFLNRKSNAIRSHDSGLVGYVKSLVDHVGGPDIRAFKGEKEDWGIEYVTYTPGLVFLKKRLG